MRMHIDSVAEADTLNCCSAACERGLGSLHRSMFRLPKVRTSTIMKSALGGAGRISTDLHV